MAVYTCLLARVFFIQTISPRVGQISSESQLSNTGFYGQETKFAIFTHFWISPASKTLALKPPCWTQALPHFTQDRLGRSKDHNDLPTWPSHFEVPICASFHLGEVEMTGCQNHHSKTGLCLFTLGDRAIGHSLLFPHNHLYEGALLAAFNECHRMKWYLHGVAKRHASSLSITYGAYLYKHNPLGVLHPSSGYKWSPTVKYIKNYYLLFAQ